uniref:Uncharacterized protein n=1 Tax=Ascaris lumbricoides TaxID=6252 RepID=A0A0M3HKV6_ASCLU
MLLAMIYGLRFFWEKIERHILQKRCRSNFFRMLRRIQLSMLRLLKRRKGLLNALIMPSKVLKLWRMHLQEGIFFF